MKKLVLTLFIKIYRDEIPRSIALIFLISSFIFLWRIFLFKTIIQTSKDKNKEEKAKLLVPNKEDKKKIPQKHQKKKKENKDQKKYSNEENIENLKNNLKEEKNEEKKTMTLDIFGACIIFYVIGIFDLITLPLALLTFLGFWRINKTLKAYYVLLN